MTPYIKDTHLLPISTSGANWENIKQFESQDCEGSQDVTLANEIRNQMLYYKVLRDKHDNSLINTLDLNSMLMSGESGANGQNYVKLEHTKFSSQNKKAMSLLIILLERKNEILKNLSKISNQRQALIAQAQKLM